MEVTWMYQGDIVIMAWITAEVYLLVSFCFSLCGSIFFIQGNFTLPADGEFLYPPLCDVMLKKDV